MSIEELGRDFKVVDWAISFIRFYNSDGKEALICC
jgi:hypothetical protein